MTPCAWSPPSRAASSAGASGPSTTTGSRTPPRRALRIGRSAAIGHDRDGRDVRLPGQRPQLVRRRRRAARSRLTLPANFTADATVEAVRAARAGRATRRSTFTARPTPTRRCPTDRRSANDRRSRRPTRRAGPGSRPSACRSCRRRRSRRRRPRRRWTASTAPASTPATLLDIGRIWEGGGNCAGGRLRHRLRHLRRGRRPDEHLRPRRPTATTRCTSSSASATSSRATRSRPTECVAHWLADSVEILIDPRGRASDNAMDTANTFKLGIFPFTNDPTNSQRQRRQRPVLGA